MEKEKGKKKKKKGGKKTLERHFIDSAHILRIYHWLPKNWPEKKITYTSSLIWGDCCIDLYAKYQESSTLEECTEVALNDKGQLGLRARLDLPATCLLERFVGEVIDGACFENGQVQRTDMHVFLYDYGLGKLYVDTTRQGSLTRFIRKVEPDDAEVNALIIPINLDGQWQLFVELQREIKVGEEIVLGRYYGYHDEDAEWKGKLGSLYPNDVIQGMQFNSPAHAQLMNYEPTACLTFERLPEDHHFLAGRRCLSDWVSLQVVQDKSLPYCGQIGTFAACDIRSGTYIGEYAGEVFACDGSSESLYVAKYENTFEAEETDLVRIDGLKVGNEMRYINDSRNTGRPVNVQFILAWVGGSLHLFVVSVADIRKGEEILIDYGEEYWEVLQDWKETQEEEGGEAETPETPSQ